MKKEPLSKLTVCELRIRKTVGRITKRRHLQSNLLEMHDGRMMHLSATGSVISRLQQQRRVSLWQRSTRLSSRRRFCLSLCDAVRRMLAPPRQAWPERRLTDQSPGDIADAHLPTPRLRHHWRHQSAVSHDAITAKHAISPTTQS